MADAAHNWDMWRAAILATGVGLATGCGAPMDIDSARFVAPPVGAEQAAAVLDAEYGITSPLPVYWVPGDCWEGIGFEHDGECIFGITFDDAIVVPHPGPGVPVSSTSLGHEKAHNRWGDESHTLRQSATAVPVWGADPHSDYEPGTRVGDANASLIASGL